MTKSKRNINRYIQGRIRRWVNTGDQWSYEYENALAALAMLRDADKSKKLNKALIVAMKEIRGAAKKSCKA